MAASAANRVALYAAVGPELTHYDVDVDGASLTRRGTVTLPANVHYCWPHASRRFLYVASSDSDSGVGGKLGANHHVTALSIDPATGALSPHGAPILLPTRPIHMTTDIPSDYILVAFSNPSGLIVYRVNPDGTPGAEIVQPDVVDPGIYAHQVRVRGDNRVAILVSRGHDAARGNPEEPGALQVFGYRNGQLLNEVSVAPNGGYGFGPRHLDFHPTEPWVYVSLERQNRLDMFHFHDTELLAAAVYQKDTLGGSAKTSGRQAAGTVKVHPNGKSVYVANRASSSTEINGKRVFVGGENTLAVFAIDPATGEPNAIQHVDTHGIHCRNFHIDPSGRLLVASHIMGLPVRDGETIREVPACLSLFRIDGAGKLDYVRKYDVEVGGKQMFWMGMVPL
ncbi:MAG TPA: beta-propeller fold lactonase family protein [Stellaceae bacterium]|jgi:6-phosphogluconolactonase (cycloisomerase 2 family)|nr:beta-propeller fold lactonase family protein [Stellaceae bacterium]